MANPNDIPQESAAKLIATLAEHAAEPSFLKIETKGLGAGLPESVPALFDRRINQLIALAPTLEAFRQAPARRRGTATVDTLASFVELVNRHKDEHSAIFADTSWPAPKLTAVIDYHQTDRAPRFGAHRIVYPFPISEEMKAWFDNNRKAMPQLDFAEFLEEHAPELDIADEDEKRNFEPLLKERFAAPNELIALSRSLEVHVGAKVKQANRLSSGERVLEFSEEHMNGKGEPVEIPGLFMLSCPAFMDGSRVRIPTRLRYRLAGGGIVWFYELWRAEFWLRQRVQTDLRTAAEETGLPAYEGKPEA